MLITYCQVQKDLTPTITILLFFTHMSILSINNNINRLRQFSIKKNQFTTINLPIEAAKIYFIIMQKVTATLLCHRFYVRHKLNH